VFNLGENMTAEQAKHAKRAFQSLVMLTFEFSFFAPVRLFEPLIILAIDLLFEWLATPHVEHQEEDEPRPSLAL